MTKNWDTGNIVEIDLGNDRLAYGIVIDFPLIAFYDKVTSKTESIELDEIHSASIAFKIWVMKYAIGKNRWKRIGKIELNDEESVSPWFYKYDRILKTFSMVRGHEEKGTERGDCLDLECAAVWDPDHVVSRLNDHFDGRPNKWVESLSAKNRTTEQSAAHNERKRSS